MSHRSVCGRTIVVLLALGLLLAIPPATLAQSSPRLVVFEGFYNPG